MRLYHTGGEIVKAPDIYRGRKNADFGQGFYLSPDREFARRWAGENAWINEYELDETGLSILRLGRDREWFEYIFHNRRAEDTCRADVVLGPIANDTLFDSMGILSSGMISGDMALRLLMIGPEYTQAAIKTERAARRLVWLGAERIERLDREARRAEQEEYQALFAREIRQMTGEDGI